MAEINASIEDDDFDGPEDFTSRLLDMRRIAEARDRHGVKPAEMPAESTYDDSTWPPRGAGE